MSKEDSPPDTPDAWTLDDVMDQVPLPHVPITRKNMKKGETEIISFRVSREDYAKIQKTVQQRRVPGIETYSDLMTDALFLWLEKFYQDNPTYDPGAAQELKMVRVNAVRHQRSEFHDLASSTLEGIIGDRDVKSLDAFHTDLIEARYSYTNQGAPPNYIKSLDRLIDHARRLLDESEWNAY